ncbi:xylan alpha-1,2-glucuronidase [Paenibacillus antibioticophila]|uniref:Xylan alpha-1,2-glucuronidase n=1 Tax=Paenibacillus antibioticophila TaxID=1274374 RepID=A0A919XP16_9BACL|nr:alpha-glucuronidase family glycosyl hydrolase [Paenibacillus antibioticophila]GIO35309.1 xylan alpha-1,2-glucuronidase [Paenibacillus antibioticophila]
MNSSEHTITGRTESTLYKAWLQYSAPESSELRNLYKGMLERVVVEGGVSRIPPAAVRELSAGADTMLGVTPEFMDQIPANGEGPYLWICLRSDESYCGAGRHRWETGRDAYSLKYVLSAREERLELTAASKAGVIYGIFHLLRGVSLGLKPAQWAIEERPVNQLRMINQWDNADGSIERGYSGRSIFYKDGVIVQDLDRVRDYARLLASVGINAISINNVNVHEVETGFITEEGLPEVARVAGVFRDYGIALFLSINFAAPMAVGGLDTADPLDEGVREWWKETSERVYRHIPDFGGFVVKADSEHRPGPFAYGRDHADGANMLADSLEPYGGLVVWRCFVYNCMQDWRDRSTDRARAAYDHFKPLDGKFKDNVLLQIKNGPMDFQVREPVSPLFGAMSATNQVIEFQIAQEYTGQQRHLCYLVPQWKQVLDFDTHAAEEGKGQVNRIVSGSLFGMKYSGAAAVSNIGDDECWTGHPLAQANLYGYGRLIWNPGLTSEGIAREWAQLTFGSDREVSDKVTDMLMASWTIYESYTAPLGVGWMVVPHYHYGPDVDGYEYSRWGTYHFADRDGIGVDRTTATGTGYAGQYFSPNREMFESLEDCPDELLLFFHHVPYGHVLHSGKTVIQHIYDTHFSGAESADGLRESWASLQSRVDAARHKAAADRFAEQSEHAKHWRDVINTYFYRKSGVPDEHGRTIYS